MLTIKSGELIAKTEELKEANTSLLASNGALKDRRDVLKVIYFPKGSSEFNAVEECWRQGKYDLLVSKYYPRFKNLTYAIANYYRTKRFKLHIVKYLSRNMS